MLEQFESGLGLDIVLWFQSWSAGLIWSVLTPLHYLGEEAGYLLFLPLLYWSVHKKTGIRLIFIVMTSALLTTFLKMLWFRPRPFHVAPELITPIYQTTSNGIPSGHTVFSTVFGLTVNRYVNRFWMTALMIAFMILTPMSRLIHGVHYPQDILAGFFIGVLFFLVFNALYDRFEQQLVDLPIKTKLLMITGALVVLFVAVVLGYAEHEARKSLLSIIAALSGGAVGLCLDKEYLSFNERGALKARVMRALVGLVTLVVLYLLLTVAYYAIAAASENAWVLMLYVLRYGLVGFWITFGAPWLFQKVRLA